MTAVETALPETDIPVLEFPAGIPGFPDAHAWALVRIGDEPSPFSVMSSLDHPGIELLVLRPFELFPDYEPELADEDAERLGITRAEDVVVLNIVNVADGIDCATANLLAPLVINAVTRVGAQVVLADGELGLRVPLLV